MRDGRVSQRGTRGEARRGRLTDLHAREDDVVLGAFAVAADAVAGLDLLEVDPAEVGAAGDEVAPEVGVVGAVTLGGLLGRLGLLLCLGTVVGDHAVVFGVHGDGWRGCRSERGGG